MMAAVSAVSAIVAPGAPARARALDRPCTKLLMSCATAPASSLVQPAALLDAVIDSGAQAPSGALWSRSIKLWASA